MKSIYVTSVERYSGKTATCLVLGKKLIDDGYKIGYLKPLSLQPYWVSGHIADEDAAFVKEVLGLSAQPWELSPVVVTPELLRKHLSSQAEINLMSQVKAAVDASAQAKDILLLEGGASMREGYAVGLPTLFVADELDSQVLVIVKYRDEIRVLDDALAARKRLQNRLAGMIINRVPVEALEFVNQSVKPFLENLNVPVLGACLKPVDWKP
jgi:hypothetical protein